ncbi:hypothetical protein C0Q70_08347 [Pomacea canaliculata]|uniref:Uncharacterized protein n=1 Tax=Pomacea canaliculata TaxID=400727 RepID=A0A2T7PHN2_POMCA|nr:hypothetical protein C0Q70_08347 [Pomacea canaliculata]
MKEEMTWGESRYVTRVWIIRKGCARQGNNLNSLACVLRKQRAATVLCLAERFPVIVLCQTVEAEHFAHHFCFSLRFHHHNHSDCAKVANSTPRSWFCRKQTHRVVQHSPSRHAVVRLTSDYSRESSRHCVVTDSCG